MAMAAAALHLPTNGGGDERLYIWRSIMQQAVEPTTPYVYPLMQRSSGGLMSQRSMEICTESLGSETGSDDGFSHADEQHHSLLLSSKRDSDYMDAAMEEEEEREEKEMPQRKELNIVNYHCSIGLKSPPRPFPPPLPSISRRDGPCIQMRHHRCNGRLIVEAIPVPAHNYLHAERRSGRLVLSLIDTFTKSPTHNPVQEESEEKDGEVEEEEEVQVVDRGTVVEVKVSAKPQPAGGSTSVKVRRSSLFINKFVVGTPQKATDELPPPSLPLNSMDGFHYNYIHHVAAAEAKLLFGSKRRSREELLHDVRWCNELRRPLFIFEQPFCIATSS